MATPNPLSDSHPNPPQKVSKKTFHIAGILTDVYGLEEIPANCKSISCLWLLHPRLKTKESMESTAASCIGEWNMQPSTDNKVGLIGVSFDQRNHGTRMANEAANGAWREGNKTHAQDMFSILHGTALDTSLLIDHLGSYIFNTPSSPQILNHIILGVSLGGHSAWQVLFADPRVHAAISIIGCPDYMFLMSDRARLSKLPTAGPSFLGSPDFPNPLITAATLYDPKAILFGTNPIPPSTPSSLIPYQGASSPHIRQLLTSKIAQKRILVCSGGDDKLVPYRCSEPFLSFLKAATGKGGWWEEGGVYLEDNIYAGVGHAFSEGMVKDVLRFVCETLSEISVSKSRVTKIPPPNPTALNYLPPVKARY
ncbi:alpha/beta-Hydrolase [Glarea lozoyensis ATCC 20868]|uniref:Alpha/beta-Hydrolase n=1 Tax=Glarea lozoyensis (strain ATCC 20868 / MF5171) TaxID=1116229 RepID=S3CU91_GLAL2|nr:alpha/beta-Hydrolase [Glarea lozoyensis ATCC 20868]EPE28589.1 alpha/beta-Hydrolase [Glarea lozoyensis ATCC 20868]